MQTNTNESLTNFNSIMGVPSRNLFIFTALECEAKAIIDFYNLKKQNHHPFSVYLFENIVLTVTGVGKTAMAGGVAYTLALFSNSYSPILINIGIAGHKSEPLGSLFLANKISDADSGKNFYPQLLGNQWPNTCGINSYSSPSTLYFDDCLNDMESAAFYEMAVKFSCSELIHSIKIVSDNQNSPIEEINADKIKQWVIEQMNSIDSLFNNLIGLHQIISPINPVSYDKILTKWHFTSTGKIKLKSMLVKWKAVSGDDWFNSHEIRFSNAKELLKKLAFDLQQKEIHL